MDLWLSDPHLTLLCTGDVIQNVKSTGMSWISQSAILAYMSFKNSIKMSMLLLYQSFMASNYRGYCCTGQYKDVSGVFRSDSLFVVVGLNFRTTPNLEAFKSLPALDGLLSAWMRVTDCTPCSHLLWFPHLSFYSLHISFVFPNS